MRGSAQLDMIAFETPLGWIALVGSGVTLEQVFFGHASQRASLAAVERALSGPARWRDWHPALRRRIEEYAEGVIVDFVDVELDLDDLTAFQRRVIKRCREIPYGESRTYGELAAAAGAARAARAVGSTMRQVRYPLVVPAHRVVRASGGGLGAPPGERTRALLRAFERRALAGGPPGKSSKSMRRMHRAGR